MNDATPETLASLFDSVCFEHGDKDAISFQENAQSICYFELQQASQALAAQLYYRFRPTYVLLDLRGHVAAEAVSILASNRISIMFVPININEDSQFQLQTTISTLQQHSQTRVQIVAVIQAENDEDPMVKILENVGVYNVVCLNSVGDLLEPMNVPQTLVSRKHSDDLYILFTSGTTSNRPKAVVGSQQSTLHRLKWFHHTFPSSDTTIVARRSKLTFIDGITELLSALLFPPNVLHAFDPNTLAMRGIECILHSPCTQITMLPSQLEQLLLLPVPPTHSLDMIIISGEPCKASLLINFDQKFSKTRLINLYGQTESTGDAMYAILTDMSNPIHNGVVAVGHAIPGVSISFSNENEIIVKGNLANRYLGGENFTTFHTGDVGFCENDTYYVQGRIDEVVKLNGQFASPTLVEAAFVRIFSIPCAATIIKGKVYALMENNNGFVFQREAMRNSNGVIPWHLIPNKVFTVDKIPTSGGAGKVSRARVKQLVTELLNENEQSPLHDSKDSDDFDSIIGQVLGVSIDHNKSFVDHGGDSATAITLLYKLRIAGLLTNSLDTTAADIIESTTIRELKRQIRTGESKSQRRITMPSCDDSAKLTNYAPHPIERFSDIHYAVKFRACVDSTPLVRGRHVYASCQGGLVQRMVHGEQSVIGHYALQYKVQAGMTIVDESVIICGYKDDSQGCKNCGIVVSMGLNLSSTKWSTELRGPIKSTPIEMNGQVWVVAGSELFMLDSLKGTIDSSVQLPSQTKSRPVKIRHGCTPCVVYAFKSWDIGLAIVDVQGILRTAFSQDIISPVYADLLDLGSSRIVAFDILGYMHDLNMDTFKISSTKVSNSPIFGGAIVMAGKSIVFGSHDGFIRCVSLSSFQHQLWQFDAKSVVCTAPLALGDTRCLVCTTGGDVIMLQGEKEIWRTKLNGEIWSSPVSLGSDNDVIVVGARDSNVHFITVGAN